MPDAPATVDSSSLSDLKRKNLIIKDKDFTPKN
jgi:hypothetical protein